MTAGALVDYVGAGEHPQSAAAVFDRTTGHFRAPRGQGDSQETERVYSFNSLGFRGSEFDPSAAFRVFVCGCSYTFGMGVETDRTWPVVFTRLAAAELGVPNDKSHVQNFSQIGASNNYVTRTLIRQCDLAPPTLAIAAFTHINRTEYLDGMKIKNLGYWNIRPELQYLEKHDAPGKRFFRQYSDHFGLQNLLINMIFFQSAMERRGIPYIMLWVDIERFDGTSNFVPNALHDFYAVLEQSRISRFSIKQPSIRVDTAEGHPGPRSHERFAPVLANEFKGRLLARRSIKKNANPSHSAAAQKKVRRVSISQLTRVAINAATNHYPADALFLISDTLAVEHFVGAQPIEIDVERRPWSISAARLRIAYAEYVTVDILRFNFWLNALMAQEFINARGGRLKIGVPEYWLPEHEQCSAVLHGLLTLLAPESFYLIRPMTIR